MATTRDTDDSAAATKPARWSPRDDEVAPELNSGILPGNVHADDWVMFVLAVISVGLLGFVVLSPPAYRTGMWIFFIDSAVCAVFFVEFLRRWRNRRWGVPFLIRNWYELFAMVPFTYPTLASHHFLAVVLLLVRIGRATDRAVGEQFTYHLVDKLSGPIVCAIKKPVTIAVLDEVVKVLETGNYPENLAKSLSENRTELRAIITEKLTQDPQLGKFRRVPFHGEIVQAMVDASFRVILEVLLDPRIDDFFSSVVRDNREQIRRAVELGLNEEDAVDKERLLPVRTQRSAIKEFDEHHRERRSER